MVNTLNHPSNICESVCFVQGRIPFVVPDRVLWSQLASALNTKFTHSCGLGLTEDSLCYLATKLFGASRCHIASFGIYNVA